MDDALALIASAAPRVPCHACEGDDAVVEKWRDQAGAMLLGICTALSPRYPLAQQPPPGGDSWQRQQPTRERTQDLLREQDAAASPEERRQELRTLNELHRELMPPGTTVPAPRVAPPPAAAPDQAAPRRDR